MKEGINLTPNLPEKESADSFESESGKKLKNFLKRINLVLLTLVIFSFLLSTLVSYISQQEQNRERLLEKTLMELSQRKRAVESLVKRQEDLKFIGTLRIDFRKYLDSVRGVVPQDLVLNSLRISLEQIEISARAKNSPSFSLFVNGLSSLKIFSKINLIRSVYNEEVNDFSFTLICQISTPKK